MEMSTATTLNGMKETHVNLQRFVWYHEKAITMTDLQLKVNFST